MWLYSNKNNSPNWLPAGWQGWNFKGSKTRQRNDDDEINHKLEYVVFLCLVPQMRWRNRASWVHTTPTPPPQTWKFERWLSTPVYQCLPGAAGFDSPPRTFPLLRLTGFNYALGATGQPLSEHKFINTRLKKRKHTDRWTQSHVPQLTRVNTIRCIAGAAKKSTLTQVIWM